MEYRHLEQQDDTNQTSSSHVEKNIQLGVNLTTIVEIIICKNALPRWVTITISLIKPSNDYWT